MRDDSSLMKVMISGYHQQVADHYERYPYPDYPWYALGSWRSLASVDLRNWGIEGAIENAWIVGSGTIAPLMFGRRNPRVKFLATDLSSASLRSARRRLALFGIRNVQTRVEDLIEVKYPQHFDAIDCYGVLHHTASPALSLLQLAQSLRKGGVLRLMVYAAHARRRIEELRAEVVGRGETSPSSKRLSESALAEWVRAKLREPSPAPSDGLQRELATPAGRADALLNPIVHVYTQDTFDRLLKSVDILKPLKIDATGNFIAHLQRV